jgi:hypothetical protein
MHLRWDRQNTGQEEQRHIADVGPDRHRRHHRQRQTRVGQPFDAPAQHRADHPVGGRQDPAPQHRHRQRRADPRDDVERAEQPGTRQSASQHRRRPQAQHDLGRYHDRDEGQRDQQRVAEPRIGEHRTPIVQPHKADRAQEIPTVQAQPHHHQHRQQQEAHHAEQARRQQPVTQQGRTHTPRVHGSN